MTACLESAEPNSFIAVISGAPHLNHFVGLKIMVRAPVSAYIGHLDYFTKSKKSLYPFVWTWRPRMLKDIQKHKPNHVNYTSQSLRLCRSIVFGHVHYPWPPMVPCHLEYICLQTFHLLLFTKATSILNIRTHLPLLYEISRTIPIGICTIGFLCGYWRHSFCSRSSWSVN